MVLGESLVSGGGGEEEEVPIVVTHTLLSILESMSTQGYTVPRTTGWTENVFLESDRKSLTHNTAPGRFSILQWPHRHRRTSFPVNVNRDKIAPAGSTLYRVVDYEGSSFRPYRYRYSPEEDVIVVPTLSAEGSGGRGGGNSRYATREGSFVNRG